MFTNYCYTTRSSARLRSFRNQRRFVTLATLIFLLSVRQSITAQTAETAPITVTGEPVPTATPHDNFREMRQHIMPEVSGTEITVTKKATVIKLDQQPPVEDNNLQELFTKAPGFLVRINTRRANSISAIGAWVIHRNPSLPWCLGTVSRS
jgi:hypothetical protein